METTPVSSPAGSLPESQPPKVSGNETEAAMAPTPKKGRGVKPKQAQSEGRKSSQPRRNAGNPKPNQPKSKINTQMDKSDLIQKIADCDIGDQTGSSRSKPTSGPRKQNLNHLLNFTYESARDSSENYYEYERLGRQFWSTKLSKNSYFSKEQFLQANCQFVVRTSHDYSIHMCDPDRLVDWDKIEEVHIDTHSTIACPICLYEPTAGKMTKCGHVYCWSCILHYLSLSDKPWRKCPICFESIYKNDLKSVRVIKHTREYRVGDEIELTLLFKPRVSKYATVCLPADVAARFTRDEKAISYDVLADERKYEVAAPFLKIHARSPQRILGEVVRRERDELERQLEAEKDQPEVCFVHEALGLLEEREMRIREEITRSGSRKRQEVEVKEECKTAVEVERPSVRYVDAFDDKISEEEPIQPAKQDEGSEKPVEGSEDQPVNAKNSEPSNSSSLDLAYFYQSSDGQRIFISGFNNRCLLTEYTSLNRAPARIKARILACDSLFMTEENRRQRFKYLAHLPLHSEFKIVELDLVDAISEKTAAAFRDEFDERRRLRERKIAREKRESDRLAAAAAEKEAIVPHYYVQSAMGAFQTSPKEIDKVVDYLNEFPEASSSPPFSSGASLISDNSSSLSTVSTGTASSSSASANSAHSDPALAAQISFAQMIKHDPTADPFSISRGPKPLTNSAWPALESTAQSKTGLSLGGWVSMAKQQQQQMSMSGRAKRYQNAPVGGEIEEEHVGADELEERESMPAPSFKQSFFSAIDESLKLIESKKEAVNEPGSTVNKKKKKNKQLLFSTSLNRGF